MPSGYSPWFWVEKISNRARKSFGLVGVALLLIALPYAIIGDDILHETTANSHAEAAVETWLGADSAFDVAAVQVRFRGVDVVIVRSGDLPDPAELASDLATTLEQPLQLSLRVIPETTHAVTADQNGQIISQDTP